MRRTISAALALLVAFALSLTATTAHAVEDTWDYSVQVSSAVQASPATITLSWPQDTNGTPSSYTIYRKAPGSSSWGSSIASLPGSATTYTDTSVSAGTVYEYQIVKVAGSYNGYGYIETGINTPLVDSRGKVVLVVDNTMSSPLSAELAQLQQDLAGDGWTVIRHDVARTDSVPSVKALITAEYNADSANVKSVFLFGHVPVPYSGQLNPDGHADHLGAWPADAYYGNFNGPWTDNSVNYVQTVNTDPVDAARLTNVPGDGKFDQSQIPSTVVLQVGRVDLSNLPGRVTWGGPATFPTETELLRKYLNKDHNFRTRVSNPPRRAIVGDYFGVRSGEAFSSSAYGGFAALVGASNVRNLNVEFSDQQGVWIPQAAANDYLLAYGCGAGSYTTMSGVGNAGNYNTGTTPEMVQNNVHGVFNLLFGSWLGDFDHEDDFMRSPLVTDYGLVAVWSGRPHWYLHPMGQGATIGYVAQLVQNNNGLYQNQINTAQNDVHITLMGDPTLRLHPVIPVSGLSGAASGSNVALTWSASSDSAITGYHVYRAGSATGAYTRLTSSPIASTNFTDSSGSSTASYMVRAVKLENTTSGSYYNASQGAFWSASGTASTGGTSGPATTTPPADTTPPTVAVSTPTAGATVLGSAVALAATANDNVGVAGVQFKIDNVNLGAELTSAPFTTTWNTTGATNGTHVITAVARDAAGNTSLGTISVTVNNPVVSASGSGSTTGSSGTTASSGSTSGTTTSGGSTNLSSGTGTSGSNPILTGTGGTVIWFDDALPAGASGSGSGGDSWNWVTSNPTPFSGTSAHQTAIVAGLHEHSFNFAAPFVINNGEDLFTYVYLDPANPPTEIMLSWMADNWEHRAYWGANNISYGTDKTASRYYVGALPATGQWVRLEVPASDVALQTKSITGMGFSTFGGRTTYDVTGKALPTAPALITGSSASSTTAAIKGVDTPWFDDALPAGASGSGNGETWNWVTSNPAPFSGNSAHQSVVAAGLHEHSFNFASTAFTPSKGDTLYTYVYLDPANPPTEVMLSWAAADGWEHRAFWGADKIGYGTPGTAGHFNAGALPATGQWARLEIPASAVGLEGASLSGMGFSTYDGRVTYDVTGKSNAPSSSSAAATTPSTSGGASISTAGSGSTTSSSGATTSGSGSTSTTTTATPEVVWFDDALPAGASGSADGGDSWNWVGSNPTAYSGTVAHQSAVATGLHEHSFNFAAPFAISPGDTIFTYVYLDPANPPSEIMLSWMADSWEHRVYWGADKISYGTDGTAGRYYAGTLPATGQWVRLAVPASAVGLEGQSVVGMGFSTYDGRVTYDKTGKGGSGASTTSGSTTSTSGSTTTVTKPELVWFDDALPAGASGSADGGDSWNWVASNPTPASGTLAHQSAVATGLHEHSFNFGAPLAISTGDTIFTYVYLDPANPPSEIMLSWMAANWEHRVYWGADKISYGTDGTPGRYYAGALPTTGQWVRLVVPASAVGLEGQSVAGMGFSTYDGRATYDKTGLNGAGTATVASGGSTTSSGSGGSVASSGGSASTAGSGAVAGSGGTSGTTTSSGGTPIPALAENTATREPQVGDYQLRILTPTTLELQRITTKAPDPATSTVWNFVDASGNLHAPAASEFTVTVNGAAASVQSVNFRRRVAYAPLAVRDLRIDNCIYLQLGTPVAEGSTVEVKNPDATLWDSSMQFKTAADPLRYSPAIHVNQEGYTTNLPKKAMVGYYLGSAGELSVTASIGFKLVDATTGVTAYAGTLTPRQDVGFTYAPTPYQAVLQADFSSFTTPGEYQLVVPGLGASLPFLVNDGVAMAFLRTYELGLYHQRSGTTNALPYTRFVHDADHMAPAEIPTTDSAYTFTWNCIASKSGGNTSQTAPQLTSAATQLYPFVNQGTVDVSGGHFDAGDWSKYTINVGQLIHVLLFTADSIQGADQFDNLGVPESGDGVSDILQEAKREADYIAKLQDADGGFYFIVYPKTREYESGNPAPGDQQVVWPKNTASTGVAVGALAEMASSPKFKAAYPAAAAAYLAQAQKGWQFLINAIAKYGKAGAYQKVTFYGDNWNDNDELAWAACAMYVATGDPQYQQKLFQWFPNPADPSTFLNGWSRLADRWGNVIRTYAFAARSGRLSLSQLDPNYLAACQGQITAAGEDALMRTNHSAYGTAFPDQSKSYMAAGWYFSLDGASDMAAAYQLNPKPEYIDAIVANMNYEGGTNPVNSMFITGLGMKRRHEIVDQYAQGDRRVLPPDGIPIGSVASAWSYLQNYGGPNGNELQNLSFPSDAINGTVQYPFYDRWADTYNLTTEFITVNQARSLEALAFLAAQTPAKSTAWKPGATLSIAVPSTTAQIGVPLTLTLSPAGVDLTGARIVWEARDQQPDFGSTFTISPVNPGPQWVEVEVTWPDGRRMFGTNSFNANAPVVTFIDDALPAGATTNGNEPWTWVSSSPTPQSGTLAHQSPASSGEREHGFLNASAPLTVGTGDTLFAWVYLDPSAMPSEIMVHWYDGSSWEHRAYWGANQIGYGNDGTAGRRNMGALPAGGGWVKLTIPASAVGLEGASVTGMCFSAYGGGKVTWDSAGRITAGN